MLVLAHKQPLHSQTHKYVHVQYAMHLNFTFVLPVFGKQLPYHPFHLKILFSLKFFC